MDWIKELEKNGWAGFIGEADKASPVIEAEGDNMRVDVLAHAVFNEARDPVMGGLFMRMVLGELTIEDVDFACEFGFDCPTWVGVIAGGNPDFLSAVSDVSLQFFFGDLIADTHELEEGLVDETRRVFRERALLPTDN